MPETKDILCATLVFIRVGGIFSTLPIYGDAPTPLRARVLLSVAFAVGLYPLLPEGWAPDLNVDLFMYAAYVVKEALLGVVIGFMAKMAFAGIIMAASVVSYQMGFGTGTLFMADAGAQMDTFTAFHRILCMLIFIGLNLHHIFIDALVKTFTLIPGGMATLHAGLGELIITTSAGIFAVAAQLAAPIIVALLFTMTALGLIARTVPQMNVFTMSFPLSFFIGLIVYVATIPLYPQWMNSYFTNSTELWHGALRGIAP